MKTPQLVHWWEIPVEDMDRAITFYEAVLGIKLARNTVEQSDMAWFPMEQGAAGATGSLIKYPGSKPSRDGSNIYFSVDSIEDTLVKVSEAGGEIIQEKMSIGEHGFIAHFADLEGNRASLHSMS